MTARDQPPPPLFERSIAVGVFVAACGLRGAVADFTWLACVMYSIAHSLGRSRSPDVLPAARALSRETIRG